MGMGLPDSSELSSPKTLLSYDFVVDSVIYGRCSEDYDAAAAGKKK